MPDEVSGTAAVVGRSPRAARLLIVLLIIAGAMLASRMVWNDLHSGLLFAAPQDPSGSAADSPVPAASSGTDGGAPPLMTDVSAPGPGHVSTHTPTPALIATKTLALQPNGAVAPPHLHTYEVTQRPDGGNQCFLVHMVATGETLELIAANYDTTVAAIIAVNHELVPPLWADYPIVIPVGAKDAADLPAFDVYVVEAFDGITAESLAEVLGVDAAALEHYNMCNGNCPFKKGDVLLIPRQP